MRDGVFETSRRRYGPGFLFSCMDNYFKTRRTVRRFSDRPVTDAEIRSILEGAMRAPTCGNMQLYSVIVSRDGELRASINETHFNQPAATGASVILTVCADFNRFTRWCRLNNADAAYGNFLSFTSAMTDALILAQQITTIAEMEGMGCCWLGTVSYNTPRIRELLRLPEMVFPVAALALGWPSEQPELCERMEVDSFLHFDTYKEPSDKEVADYFRIKDEFPANAGFAAENGKENLAQVFAEVRYPRSVNEPVSVALLEELKKAGFIG